VLRSLRIGASDLQVAQRAVAIEPRTLNLFENGISRRPPGFVLALADDPTSPTRATRSASPLAACAR
jgi:hypothetical protein